jgi:hypothetical protein
VTFARAATFGIKVGF